MLQKIYKYRTHNSFVKLGSQSLFSSFHKQEIRIKERKLSESFDVKISGLSFKINPGVYKTGIDTELMINVLRNERNKSFLEIGCGCGAISIFLAKRCKTGLAVDINELSVNNTVQNIIENQIQNLTVKQSDVFNNVEGKYDLLICNPPYNMHEAKDHVERMFWDPQNNMKLRFFKEADKYLNKNGKVFFGWADFNDLDFNFPVRIAMVNGWQLIRTYSQPSRCSSYRFIVFEFHRLKNIKD